MRPNVLSFADVHGFTQLDGKLGHAGNLYGVGVLETLLDEDGVGYAPN
jgi:hypothetical protein